MKKNIRINIAGQLYNIDEDAYELLNSYETSLNNYFNTQKDGAEIFKDIEARVAELFSEIKVSGIEAITIEHVQDIINRIGAPEQIEDGNGNIQTIDQQQTIDKPVRKKLYRDTNQKLLFGVLAGLSAYFGGNRTVWRISFVILSFFASNILFAFCRSQHYPGSLFCFTIPIITYLICTLVIPAAKTPEQRLKMKGLPINVQTIGAEVNKKH